MPCFFVARWATPPMSAGEPAFNAEVLKVQQPQHGSTFSLAQWYTEVGTPREEDLMALDRYHLTKRNDEWRLEKARSNHAIRKASTKADAVKKSRLYMKSKGGSLRIHKVDGTIQEERTYPRSKDPRRTKG